jgi:hypothetical protein
MESKDRDIQALKEQMTKSEKEMEEKMEQMVALYVKKILEAEAFKLTGKDMTVQMSNTPFSKDSTQLVLRVEKQEPKPND